MKAFQEVFLKEEGPFSYQICTEEKAVGTLSYEPETKRIRFAVKESERGKHYASRGLYLALQEYKKKGLTSFEAYTAAGNEMARHVLEHNGFQRRPMQGEELHYVYHDAATRRDNHYAPEGEEVLYLAGGCFWGTERVFKLLKGVTDTCVGYANGTQKDPRYEDIIRHNTGYRETVRVTYDPALISLEKVLKAYFLCIDPTEKDAQRGDVGTQYQTGVYYKDPALKERIERVFAEERKKTAVFQVELKPLECFYEAEEYHQDYLDKIPDGYCHITAVDLEKVKALNEE
ncbi:MAG: peptide-methionine (S)-S-oxide reductase MsrA [Erysipelotrichaceae bacterium]|nr:peptide-methionine (S)-S-oxide reductase MsrA [Erysipelotrichaceae bacterium]